jgi:hypothetical protein
MRVRKGEAHNNCFERKKINVTCREWIFPSLNCSCPGVSAPDYKSWEGKLALSVL